MREEGYIDQVSRVRFTTYLAADAAEGATELYVEDVSEFEDEGGTLELNEVEYDYERTDYDENIIYLSVPLEAAADAEDEVTPVPAAWELHAAVITSEEDEALTAVVHHSLYNRLPEGIREYEHEAVAIELVGDTWYVVDILGQPPTAITVDELDEEFVGGVFDAAAVADQALAEAEAAMDFAISRNKTFRQDDEPDNSDGPLTEGDVWFDTNDGNKIRVYDGSAWVDADNALFSDLDQAVQQAQQSANQALDDAQNAFDAANQVAGVVDALADKVDTSVKSYVVQYAVNSSETTAPTSGWSANTPTRTPGTFIWTRTIVTYQDSTSSTTSPALLTGNTGADGSDGISVTAVTPYFRTVTTGAAAPAKPTTATPTGWTATEPAYVANTELYRTEKVTYSNGTFAYTNVSKVASYTAAVQAMNAANGKNKVVFSTTDATGTNYADGDIWYKRSGTNIIGQWEFVSGEWQSRTLSDSALSSLTVGKLVGGDISAITMNIKNTGVIKSDNYVANSTGWRLNSAGLEMNSGGITGALIQSTATANRGIKFNNAALIAYDGSGNQTFSVTSSTGAVAMKGELRSGSTISGALINGPLETTATANRGVKINDAGIFAYDSQAGSPTLGLNTFAVSAQTGTVTMLGSLSSGSTVNGAIITGGTIQTTESANRGIKINASGMVAYDSKAGSPTLGQPILTIDAANGNVAMKGTLAAGSNVSGATITGGTVQTNTTGPRVVISSNTANEILFHTGQAEQVAVGSIRSWWDVGGGGTRVGGLRISSPQMHPSVWNPEITLSSGYVDVDGNQRYITYDADNHTFWGDIHLTGDFRSNVLPRRMDIGLANVSITTSAQATNISFTSGRFTVAPRIVLSPQGNPGFYNCWVSNVTATGFTLNRLKTGSSGASSINVDWIAVQMG